MEELDLREKASMCPQKPGVYLMHDSRKVVIYVGKAKNLKNRVSQYFQNTDRHTIKTAEMVRRVADFETIVTSTELEAFVLENTLIKHYKPKYNILLKDDKGYPFIRLDMREEYPAMTLSNHANKDGAKYFGPFGGRSQTRDIISTISKALLLPDCSRKFPRDIGKERPCLNYHMGSCAGWCLKDSSAEDYRQRMMQAALILDGRSRELVEELKDKMEAAAEELRFEKAAELRDRLRAIEGVEGYACTGTELGLLLVGSLVAFLVSFMCIRFLMDFVRRHSFEVFGWYRIALGFLVILYFSIAG